MTRTQAALLLVPLAVWLVAMTWVAGYSAGFEDGFASCERYQREMRLPAR